MRVDHWLADQRTLARARTRRRVVESNNTKTCYTERCISMETSYRLVYNTSSGESIVAGEGKLKVRTTDGGAGLHFVDVEIQRWYRGRIEIRRVLLSDAERCELIAALGGTS